MFGNNVDRAVRGYGNALERIQEQHTHAVKAAEDAATKSAVAAEEKLVAARDVYEKALARADSTLQEIRNAAGQARLDAEQIAMDEFDTKMRQAVGAPAGARIVQHHGSRLVLDLADGRQPIASMTHVGSDVWQVEGGEGATLMVGGAVKARCELWQRCRVSMHAEATDG